MFFRLSALHLYMKWLWHKKHFCAYEVFSLNQFPSQFLCIDNNEDISSSINDYEKNTHTHIYCIKMRCKIRIACGYWVLSNNIQILFQYLYWFRTSFRYDSTTTIIIMKMMCVSVYMKTTETATAAAAMAYTNAIHSSVQIAISRQSLTRSMLN